MFASLQSKSVWHVAKAIVGSFSSHGPPIGQSSPPRWLAHPAVALVWLIPGFYTALQFEPHNHDRGESHFVNLQLQLLSVSLAAMSNALSEYLAALEARDVRERAHMRYIDACEQ